MKPRNKKQKGRELERYVAEQIKLKGLDPRAYANSDSGAGNRDKRDVVTNLQVCGQNAGIECKNHAKAQVSNWWEQTRKLESLGCEPVLVYKLKNERYEDAKVVLYLDTMLEILKHERGVSRRFTGITESNPVARELKYKMDSARNAVREVIKVLEKYEN